MTSTHERRTPFSELTDEERRQVSDRLAALLPSEDPERYWDAMSEKDQYAYLWGLRNWQPSGEPPDPATQAAFEALPPEDLDPDPHHRKFIGGIRTPEQVKSLPPPQWLLEGYLVNESLAMLWGEWNAGKSFLALTWAGLIGCGSHWLSVNATRQTKVLYVCAEGLSGFGPRIRAWEMGQKIYQMSGVDFYGAAVPLLDYEEMDAFISVVKDLGYGLVVWDTLARMIPGIEENSSKEVGLVVQAMDRLRVQAHCTSLVLHHSNKGGNGARGVSAFLGACDTELRLQAEGQELTLSVEQQRDWKRRDDLKLWLQSVPNTDSATIVAATGQGPVGRPPMEQKIIDEMRAHPGLDYGRADMANAVGCDDTTANKILFRLVREGTCARVRRGQGYEYSLVSAIPAPPTP